MSDIVQNEDVDSIELSTTTQLSPHSTTDKVSTVDREDGQEFISLDETYSVTGQESLQIIAANCREYLNNKRLHPSGFSALEISGVEGLVPGYDRFNAHKGGESFIGALKEGFMNIIRAAKKFLLAVIDWVVRKIRAILGFEKTEKELAVVAEYSEDVKRDLSQILGQLVGSEKIELDTAELFEALPGNITQREAFTIIQNRNKSVLEQVEALESLQGQLKEVETTINGSGNVARQARGRYQQAVARLRNAWKDQEAFSQSDILEFRSAIDQEVAINLNPVTLRDTLAKLIEQAYGLDLGSVGVDKAFKEKLSKSRDILNVQVPVRVTPEQFARVRGVAAKMGTMLNRGSVPFDADTLNFLKNVIEVDDAELINNIDQVFDGAGVLKLSYTEYCARINEYAWCLDQLVTVAASIRRSIAGIVNWSNKVDRLMTAYIAKDLNTILAAEKELLTPKGNQIVGINDDQGNKVDSTFTLNYDELYIAKHPYIGTALMSYRAKTSELRKQYKVFDRVNAGLKKIGVQSRI